ncbi:MAG: restriction endonuclease subunit S [Defluviicoccus sp.]|nr:MAG: restriction endonuclease subunit S [Defluviicoccus sp.]
MSALKRVAPDIAESYERTKLRGNEVLIAIRGTVGATVVVSPDMEGMNISREVAMIPLMDGVLPRFLMYLLACPISQAVLMDHVKGVAQSGINLSDLRTFPVPIPPEPEQDAIVSLLDESFERVNRIAAAESASLSLPMLNQSILAKAFRGELVPQDPNDEPASELLARIKAERAANPPQRTRGRRRKTQEEADDMPLFSGSSEKPLADILNSNSGAMRPETLWQASGLSIDDFYKQLKREVESGLIREDKNKQLLSTLP